MYSKQVSEEKRNERISFSLQNLAVVCQKFAALSRRGHVAGRFLSAWCSPEFLFSSRGRRSRAETETKGILSWRQPWQKIFNAFSPCFMEFLTNHSCPSKGDYRGNDYSVIQPGSGCSSTRFQPRHNGLADRNVKSILEARPRVKSSRRGETWL